MSRGNAYVITVGSELLWGLRTDTNTAHIVARLAEAGIPTDGQESVPDVRSDIAAAVTRAIARADLVVVTGGLGPTTDDLTREAISDALKLALKADAETSEILKKKFGGEPPATVMKQSLIPKGAQAIPPTAGTAAGIFLARGDKVLVAFPGVPGEMAEMLEKVLPRLVPLGGATVQKMGLIKTTGCGEAQIEAKLEGLVMPPDTTYGMLAHQGEITIEVVSRGPKAQVEERLAEVQQEVLARLGGAVFAIGDECLEATVGRLLEERAVTLSVAESCTGGLLSARLTDVPGSSSYFLGGVIAYSNQAKVDILGVPEDVLESFGAVSVNTAVAMAGAVQEFFASTIGIGITGICGPKGGSPERPVGTVFIAVSTSHATLSRRFELSGDRSTVKRKSTQAALNLLRDFVMDRYRAVKRKAGRR